MLLLKADGTFWRWHSTLMKLGSTSQATSTCKTQVCGVWKTLIQFFKSPYTQKNLGFVLGFEEGISNKLTNYETPEPIGYHRIYKTLPLAPILSQLDPLYPPPTNLPKIHSDPIYILVFQVVSFLRAFPPKPCTLPAPLPCLAHLILLYLRCLIIFSIASVV
jgi:hypothetical protein